MRSLAAVATVLLAACANLATAADATFYSCYDTQGSLQEKNETEWNARGPCRETCVAGVGYNVMAMSKGTYCYCGQTLPPSSGKVDKSKCSQVCPGYSPESCGDRLGKYFSVYLTGLDALSDIEVDSSPSSSASSSMSSTSSSSTSTSTSSTSTSNTASATSDADQSSPTATHTSSKSSSINTAAVAAGSVVGILGAIAIAAGAFLFLRNKRRQRIEEEYRRSAAVREFTKKPEQDHRLDPGMIQRRDSVGSIADNQDYSRRILKVTNPDGT